MTPVGHHSAGESDRDAVAFFDDNASRYSTWTRTGINFRDRITLFKRKITEISEHTSCSTAIDLGCGSGDLSVICAQAGFTVLSIDGSAQMLGLARVRLAAEGVTAAFRQERLPLAAGALGALAGTAGLVVASSVIEYVDDDAAFLTQCRTLLAPDGHALVSVPNALSPARRVERLLGNRGPLRGTIVEVQRHQYTALAITDLARHAGLAVEGIYYFALPCPRLVSRLTNSRRPRLATLMLGHFRREPTSAPMALAYVDRPGKCAGS